MVLILVVVAIAVPLLMELAPGGFDLEASI
jgi:hypothetical protein